MESLGDAVTFIVLCQEGQKLYPQIYLDECLYEL